ncbi:MAG: hypothetical protein QOF51_2603 [Chloroflexota bacterium]|nr:hypothetical protein [Chloroflexota bacterium]
MFHATQDDKEDLYYGQLAMIVARWFLIATGTLLTLWSAKTIADVTVPIAIVIALMAMNFFLHGRYLMRQPVNARLVYGSAALDLLVIGLLMLFWAPGHTGLASLCFVLLYPVLLAFALVFPPRVTLGYAIAAIAIYVGLVFIGGGVDDLTAFKTLLQRVVTLLATAGLATYFWRIQRRRRAVAAEGPAPARHRAAAARASRVPAQRVQDIGI